VIAYIALLSVQGGLSLAATCPPAPLSKTPIPGCKDSVDFRGVTGESARLCPTGQTSCIGEIAIPTAGSDLGILSFHAPFGRSGDERVKVEWTCPEPMRNVIVSVHVWMEARSINDMRVPCDAEKFEFDASRVIDPGLFEGRVRAFVRVNQPNCFVPVYLLARVRLPERMKAAESYCRNADGCLVVERNLSNNKVRWNLRAGKQLVTDDGPIVERAISLQQPEPCLPVPVSLEVGRPGFVSVAEVRF